jgi:hypothetical protein
VVEIETMGRIRYFTIDEIREYLMKITNNVT